MNAKTRPGLQIYSNEWMAEVATDVQEPMRPVVKAICEAYQLGDSGDPNLLAEIIAREITSEVSGWEHHVDGAWVRPDGVEYDLVSSQWFYVANGLYYLPELVTERRVAK